LEHETGIPQTTISAIENARTALGADGTKMFVSISGVHPAGIISDWKRSAA